VILAGEVLLHLGAEVPPEEESSRPEDEGDEDEYIRDD
jgi:hypothetical protein